MSIRNSFRRNPRIETNGCITLAYVREHDNKVTMLCPHIPRYFGNFGDAEKADDD